MDSDRKDLEKTSKKFDRPVFFIELGLCSAKGCAAAPWTHEDPNMIYDADEQARFYQAAFETFWDEPWFIGFAWWEWSARLYKKEDAATNIGFAFTANRQNKHSAMVWKGKINESTSDRHIHHRRLYGRNDPHRRMGYAKGREKSRFIFPRR
jgi:hypothetical protein